MMHHMLLLPAYISALSPGLLPSPSLCTINNLSLTFSHRRWNWAIVRFRSTWIVAQDIRPFCLYISVYLCYRGLCRGRCHSKDIRTSVSVLRMAKILIWMAARLGCASETTLTALPWVNLPVNRVNGYFAHVICLISVTSWHGKNTLTWINFFSGKMAHPSDLHDWLCTRTLG